MEAEQRRAAKEQMIALMQAGHRGPGGCCPSRDPGQSFDSLSAAASGAHPRESCIPGWKTWTLRQTAHGRVDMAGKLLSHVARHAKPCGAGGLPGTVWPPDQYRLSQPGPCQSRPGKAHSSLGEKKWMRLRPHQLNPSGKRAQGGCFWSRLRKCPACSPPWRPPLLGVLPVQIRVWRIFRRGLFTCWCERCSFSGWSDWIAPGICAATQAMRWACSRADLGPTDTFTPNASSHRWRRLTERKPSRMG
jgi:hypothetical protein